MLTCPYCKNPLRDSDVAREVCPHCQQSVRPGLGTIDSDSGGVTLVLPPEAARRDLYTDAFAASFEPLDSFRFYEEHFRTTRGCDPLDRMLEVDTRFYLPNDMLVKVDRMSMACSLEARVPFLDYTLVELGARIPPRIKFKGREKKALLKRAGVVLDERRGQQVFYRLRVPCTLNFFGCVEAVLDEFGRPDRVRIT